MFETLGGSDGDREGREAGVLASVAQEAEGLLGVRLPSASDPGWSVLLVAPDLPSRATPRVARHPAQRDLAETWIVPAERAVTISQKENCKG